MTSIVEYKGKPFTLVWSGQTKFGRRAKLALMDGSSEFWVDAAAVAGGSGAAPSRVASGTAVKGMASPKQVAALRRMLARLGNVYMFDSSSGNGQQAADQIEREIQKKGGIEKLTGRQASEFIAHIGAMLDDEM